MKFRFLATALLLGAAFAAPGLSATAPKAPAKATAKVAAKPAPKPEPVRVTLAQDLLHTVTKDGKTAQERVPAPTAVLPGSILLEEMTARNTLAVPVKGVLVRLAVPAGTVYQGLSPVSGKWKAQYSIDGGKTYADAPKRTVTQGGKSVQVAAQPSDYNAVRWLIPAMGAGETMKLGFKVQVK